MGKGGCLDFDIKYFKCYEKVSSGDGKWKNQ